METFKMRVTPEQSKIVQEILFKHGVRWPVRIGVSNLDSPHLYCKNFRLLSGSLESFFIEDSNPELTFQQFMAKYKSQHISRTKEIK